MRRQTKLVLSHKEGCISRAIHMWVPNLHGRVRIGQTRGDSCESWFNSTDQQQ